MNGWTKPIVQTLLGLLFVFVLNDFRENVNQLDQRLRALELELTALTAGRRRP